MNVPHPPDGALAVPSGEALARSLRYLLRIPLLLWHLLVHLPLVVLAVTVAGAVDVAGERLDHRLIRSWSSGLLHLFGLRVRRRGAPLPGATLFVANHVSWLDIVMLHSQRMMGLVAKREIASWPLIGRLATCGETIFHQRGNQESMGGVLHEMLARLRKGRSVGVFPEGRTRDGVELGPFHARIFLAAVEAGVPVQPVALRYGEAGRAQAIIAFQPGETFLGSFLRLLGEPSRPAEVVFLAAIAPGDAEGRRGIAELARQRVAAALHAP